MHLALHRRTLARLRRVLMLAVAPLLLAGLVVLPGTVPAAVAANAGVDISAGGPAAAPFVADEDFTGGATIDHANVIDVSGVTNPAPAAVYQSARVDNFSYTISGFVAGSSHTIRLHFAETYFSTAGSRTFNVSINGTQVLTSFDIYMAAGAKNKAIVEQFTENASTSGAYLIQFTSVVNNSLISGIEVQ
jgi:malectin (di-glucose binding ER protein)